MGQATLAQRGARGVDRIPWHEVILVVKARAVAGKVEHKYVLRGDSASQLCKRGADGVTRGLCVAQHTHVDRLVKPRSLFAKQLSHGLSIACRKAHTLLQFPV